MLGEALPPVRLQLQDSHGNTVQDVAELLAERPVQLQVLTSSLVTGGAVIQDLQVEAQMVSLLVSHERSATAVACGTVQGIEHAEGVVTCFGMADKSLFCSHAVTWFSAGLVPYSYPHTALQS